MFEYESEQPSKTSIRNGSYADNKQSPDIDYNNSMNKSNSKKNITFNSVN